MAYQFCHIETYSVAPTSVRGSKTHYNSIAQVLGEAAREPQYSTHVPHPLPSKQFFGTLTLSDFRAKHATLLRTLRETVMRKDGTTYTRKLRGDAPTLYTEIHSHPVTSAEFLEGAETKLEEVGKWLVCVKRDFMKRMPNGVDYTSVIHFDEAHIHLHILAMNTADAKLDANQLHVGKVAAAQFRAAHVSDAVASLPQPDTLPRPKKPRKPRVSKNPVTRERNESIYSAALAVWGADCARVDRNNGDLIAEWKSQNAVHLKKERSKRGRPQVHKIYTEAMKKLQDDYYEAVGKPCGLLRDGPRRARKSTREHAADKRQAAHMATEIERVKQEGAALAKKAADLNTIARDLEDAVVAMGQIIDAVAAGETRVAGGKLHLPRKLSLPTSPTTQLVRKFARLVIRHHDRLGGNGAAHHLQDEAAPRP